MPVIGEIKLNPEDAAKIKKQFISLYDDDSVEELGRDLAEVDIDINKYRDQLNPFFGEPSAFDKIPRPSNDLQSDTAKELVDLGLGIGGETVEGKRAIDSGSKIEDLLGTSLKPLSPAQIERITAFEEAKNQLANLIKLKSQGFRGEGIETGPIVGAEFPNPFGLFGEDPPNLFPAGISEYVASIQGHGEKSGDRALFRKKELDVMNPVRKSVTGSQSGLKELVKFIVPNVPNERDNDIGFYQKGFDAIETNDQNLKKFLESLKRGGFNVSGYKDKFDTPIEEIIEGLQRELLKGKGEFGVLFKDTAERLSSKKEKGRKTIKADWGI